MNFRLWLENHESYFWLTNAEFKPGDIVTAGSVDTRGEDKFWNSLEAIFDKRRAEKYSHLPSRIGAMYLANDKSIKQWKGYLNRNALYEVEIVSGTPYTTDGERWSNAHWDATKPFTQPGMTFDKLSGMLNAGHHPMQSSLTHHADIYWNGGNEYWNDKEDNDPREIELPEILLAKGSQIRILRRV